MIGIVTQIDHPDGDPDRAQGWLELAGCHPIFRVSSYTGEGIWQILNYLREPGDILPWDSEQAAERPRVVLSNKYGRLPEEGGKQFRKEQKCSCRGRDCGGSFAVMIR